MPSPQLGTVFADALARFPVETIRRECLDHVIVVNEGHLRGVLAEFTHYYNHDRPHRTLSLQSPVPHPNPGHGPVVSTPALGGLHHALRACGLNSDGLLPPHNYLGWLLRRKDRSPGTVDGYRDDLGRFVRFAEARGRAANVGEVDRGLLEAYQEELARARVRRAGSTQRLAASTRQRRLVALRSFLRFGAVQQPWFEGDLGATIDLPKLAERLPKPIDEEHRTRLRAALEEDTPQRLRDRALVLFLLSTGCRISEALALNRQDVLGDHTIVRGKGNKERSVEITERTRHALTEYLAAREDPSPALFISLHHDRLANDPELNRLSVRGAQQICERLSREAGIPRFHPHQLRHTLGTLLQEQVGDARLTAETLGHAGLASVSGYTKISDRRRREAYDQLEDAGL